MSWDVFVSYASEDKRFASRLARGLTDAGVTVWFDEFALEVGDSLRRSIDQGLRDSRYGVVILSPRFFQKEWPQKELDGLTAREDGASKVVLPVWYDVDAEMVRNYSPSLADKLSIMYGGSMKGVVSKLLRAIHKDRVGDSGWLPTPIHLSDGTEVVVLPVRPRRQSVLCLGRFPVTNAEYRRFVETTEHRRPLGERFLDDRWVGPFEPWEDPRFSEPESPVVCVDFWDALAYCRWAAPSDGRVFLPTAELWEFAASESQPGVDLARGLRATPTEKIHDQAESPAAVANDGRRDNALGVSDIFGNVWEWCGGYAYESQRARVSLIAAVDRPSEAEIRGGGFLDDLRVIHPSLRSGMLEDRTRTRHSDLGFRVAALMGVESLPAEVQGVMESQPALSSEVWEAASDSGWYYRMYERMRWNGMAITSEA